MLIVTVAGAFVTDVQRGPTDAGHGPFPDGGAFLAITIVRAPNAHVVRTFFLRSIFSAIQRNARIFSYVRHSFVPYKTKKEEQ